MIGTRIGSPFRLEHDYKGDFNEVLDELLQLNTTGKPSTIKHAYYLDNADEQLQKWRGRGIV